MDNFNSETTDLEHQLRQLVVETCGYHKDSLERKQGLNKLMCLMQESGKIWRGGGSVSLDHYDEALVKSLRYLCCNLCEATTAKQAYDPEHETQASVISWFNVYLRFRYKDIIKKYHEENKKRKHPQIDNETGVIIDPIDMIPAPLENPPLSMIEELQQWLESNKQRLQRIHLRDRPEINSYVVISRYLSGETTWKVLAQEFGVPLPTLPSFYQRRCLPLLQQWGESQGYLDD